MMSKAGAEEMSAARQEKAQAREEQHPARGVEDERIRAGLNICNL
jgi:hypothetical protein